ncbi:MAG: TonB family protein [Pyrinomonadaceae bacterium]
MKRAVLVLILCLSFIAAKAQDAAEIVYFAAPENYPLAALAVRASGEVVVDVQIDLSGKVTAAKAVSGHPLLRAASELAARKWQFSKEFAATNKIPVQLIFDYQPLSIFRTIEKSEKESEKVTKSNHPSAFRVEVISETLVPELLLLPRENGELKPEICKIHNQPLTVEIQEIIYGLISSNDVTESEDSDNEDADDEEEENRVKVSEKLFPNANLNAFGGCSNDGIKRAEVRFCQICRIKFEEWRQNKN